MENTTPNPKSARALKEEEILKFWKENNIFKKTLGKDSPEGEFVFYDGPPFATGLPHYGHILPGTIKDVIPRYKTMQGFRVPRRWGWDCHGLPIENLIEKELGLESKKDIEKFGIAEFNERARESVLRYEKDWKEIIPRTGRWIDMENAYKTMDTSYTESVWWSFKALYDKDLIYQGFKSMHLCPRCETTLSNFEVNQGYKDITDISVYAKFELISSPGTFLIAWTTTPWTLPGNAALAVKPGGIYVKAKKGEETLIVLKELAEKVLKADFEILEELPAEKLVGERYKMLFDYYQKEGQVYAADFVQAEEGTGIVHIAPAFGEEDYELSVKEKITFIQHVGTDGRFKLEVKDFAGLQVKPKDDHQKTDIEIIKYLAANNLLFAKEKIIHSYPHCWRCDTPLLNYASSSWFVKVTDIKKKLLENNAKVGWIPEDIKDGRFGKWLEGARDWSVSRSRYWGAPLPVWQNSDKAKSVVIDSLESLKKYTRKSGNEYLVMRHGASRGNQTDLVSYSKQADDHLTEGAKEDVKKSAEALKSEGIDLIVHSTFARTTETAEIVRDVLGLEKSSLTPDERLTEINPGIFDDKDWKDYHKTLSQCGEGWFTRRVEGGESFADVMERVGKFIYELEEKYKGKKILIVTHGAPAWLLYVVAGEYLPQKNSYCLPDLHASSTKVFVEEFSRFNNAEVRHLDFAPLPHNRRFEIDLHRPYIDEVVLEIEGEEYKRIPEVFDTWYDSGSVPFASRAATDFRPADFIAEGLDQTRGWFYTMAVLGSALFGEFPYKKVLVNGLVLAEDGKKMSKRLKNYPELDVVLDKYGADALRYYLLSSPAVRADDIAFSEKGLDEVMKKVLARLENVVSFYELYSSGEKVAEEKHLLDQWIDARHEKLLEDVTHNLENYELDRAARSIGDFVDDLSTWYLRRSRTRPEALPKLREVLLNLAKVSAPFLPFMAEDMYLRLKGEKESVHMEKWPRIKGPGLLGMIMGNNKNEEILEKMEETRGIVSLALEARSKANIKVRQPLAKLEVKGSLAAEYLEVIKDELNVKEVISNPHLDSEIILDTNLTEELIEEGKMRDAVRAIQEWRKEKNLKPGEKAAYEVPEEQKELFNKFAEEIKRITNVEF